MLMNEGLFNYFELNEGWLYSNMGYVLLVVIIEKVFSMSYVDFMNIRIFLLVGMSEMRVYNRRFWFEWIDYYVYGYVYDVYFEMYVFFDDLEEINYVVYFDGI